MRPCFWSQMQQGARWWVSQLRLCASGVSRMGRRHESVLLRRQRYAARLQVTLGVLTKMRSLGDG